MRNRRKQEIRKRVSQQSFHEIWLNVTGTSLFPGQHPPKIPRFLTWLKMRVLGQLFESLSKRVRQTSNHEILKYSFTCKISRPNNSELRLCLFGAQKQQTWFNGQCKIARISRNSWIEHYQNNIKKGTLFLCGFVPTHLEPSWRDSIQESPWEATILGAEKAWWNGIAAMWELLSQRINLEIPNKFSSQTFNLLGVHCWQKGPCSNEINRACSNMAKRMSVQETNSFLPSSSPQSHLSWIGARLFATLQALYLHFMMLGVVGFFSESRTENGGTQTPFWQEEKVVLANFLNWQRLMYVS